MTKLTKEQVEKIKNKVLASWKSTLMSEQYQIPAFDEFRAIERCVEFQLVLEEFIKELEIVNVKQEEFKVGDEVWYINAENEITSGILFHKRCCFYHIVTFNPLAIEFTTSVFKLRIEKVFKTKQEAEQSIKGE